MNAGEKAFLIQLVIQTKLDMLYIENFRMTEPYATKEQRDEYINWLQQQTSLTYKMLKQANDILEKTMPINDDSGLKGEEK